jgi:tetratricopeptide (TPR) repeat protein
LRALAGTGHDGDVLANEIANLEPQARRALMVAALGAGRLGPEELGVSPVAIGELTRRFLIDVERGVALVHDLVREALPVDGKPEAYREVARALLERPNRSPLDLVAAIQALQAAGDAFDAWEIYRAQLRELVGGGVAHLLLDTLAHLRDVLPQERFAIDLARARTLLARSRVADAQALLEKVIATSAGRSSARALGLLGTTLERAGRLRRAEDVFRDALARASDARERFEIMVELANLRSLRGDGASARALLDEASRLRPSASAHEQRRHRHALIVSWVYDERYAEAARVPDVEAAGRSFELRALALLARAESEDLDGAKRLLDELRAGDGDDPALVPYDGLLRVLQGDVRAARNHLERAANGLEADDDRALALLAGHYLGHALLVLGEPDAAAKVLERLTARAAEAEMDSTEAHNRGVAALAAVEAGRLDDALAIASKLDGAGIPARARFWAGVVKGKVLALRGDPAAARAAIEVAVAAVPGADRDVADGLATLELAEIELLGGDPARAAQLASAAAHRHAAAGRRWLEARALVTRGLALASTKSPADGMLAARDFAAAYAIAEPRGHAGVLARIAVGAASLHTRDHDRATADAELDEVLAAAPGPSTSIDLQLLRAARATTPPPGALLGIEKLMTALGLRTDPPPCDLVVDLSRHAITAPNTGRVVRGHPVTAALLAHLVEHDGVDAEALYLQVWRGREYHALRHRNTVYVGICRLRRALEHLLPGRTVIETTPAGWRLAEGVRASVLDHGSHVSP